MRRPAILLGIACAVAVGTAALASYLESATAVWPQGICLAGGIACILAGCLGRDVSAVAPGKGREGRSAPVWELVAGIVTVFVACLIRLALHRRLPLPDRAAFEELQMGQDAYHVLTTWTLPLEFRFSKAIAALGLLWGGPSVDALRVPFRLLGLVTLPLLYLCLRRLNVGRLATAFVVLAAASSRWLVIGSGTAYEDFSGVPFLMILLLAIVSAEAAVLPARLWAAAAGVASGILLFENSSFRYAPLLAAIWFLVLAARKRSFAPALCFFAPLVAVAAPILVDVVEQGRRSIFFEAFVRYAHDRSGLLAPQGPSNLKASLAVLAGRPVSINYLLAPEQGQAVEAVIGALFLAGLVWALVRAFWGYPRRPLAFLLALAAIVAILVASFSTTFFAAARLTAVLPILYLLAGLLLEDTVQALRGLARRLTPRAAIRIPAGILVALGVIVIARNFERTERMARDVDVRNEYLNNEYVIARHIALAAPVHSHVLVYDLRMERNWTPGGIAHWVYAHKDLTVEPVKELPEASTLSQGTLVVMGSEGQPLADADFGRLEDLARATDSLQTMQVFHGLGNRRLAASILVGG